MEMISKRRAAFIAVFLIFALSVIGIVPYSASAATEIKIIVNGETLVLDSPPLIRDDRTLVPVRGIAEKLGYTVDWDPNLREASFTNGDDYLALPIDSRYACVSISGNDFYWALEVTPQIINDRTYIPARFFAEAVGAKVGWDGENRIVYVDKPQGRRIREQSSPAGALPAYRYRGELQNGIRQGYGTAEFGYEMGSLYRGWWENGRAHGAGLLRYEDGMGFCNISGEFANGFLQKGMVFYENYFPYQSFRYDAARNLTAMDLFGFDPDTRPYLNTLLPDATFDMVATGAYSGNASVGKTVVLSGRVTGTYDRGVGTVLFDTAKPGQPSKTVYASGETVEMPVIPEGEVIYALCRIPDDPDRFQSWEDGAAVLVLELLGCHILPDFSAINVGID